MQLHSFRDLSLSRQFTVLSIGLMTVLVGIAVGYVSYFSVAKKNEQLQLMASDHARAVIEKIDRNFYERYGDVQAFAVNQLAIDIMSNDDRIDADSSRDKLQQFINTMVNYYTLYDLMMVCDKQGNVVAVNTKDKNGNSISSNFLINKNFAQEPWFKASVYSEKVKGAWYSDFQEDPNASRIYKRKAWGVAFAAPIKKDDQVIGVWYNFANWTDVTVGIRRETETMLKKTQPGAFLIITNANGQIIDYRDSTLLLRSTLSINELNSGATVQLNNKKISSHQYLVGNHQGTGAYTYAGKKWNAFTFIPKTHFSLSYITGNNGNFLIIIFLLLALASFIFFRFASSLSTQLNVLKSSIEKLSAGEFSESKVMNVTREVSEISLSVEKLKNGLSLTAGFAEQVGTGNFTSEFKPLGKNDILGNALLAMRNNLKESNESERRRIWTTEGMAQIGPILRNNALDEQDYYYSILHFIVKYLHCNQGSMFVLQENKQVLESVATYAWEKRKFHEKLIDVGNGLVGQCFLEGQTIHLRDIPQNYISITSGLGDAKPHTILIVPLKVNEEVLGILELASFNKFEPYEIELIEKLAENIAGAISSKVIQSNTTKLLAQAQQQTEELKAQEEEMRQNMEELTATQEEMRRNASEMESRIEAINQSGIASIEFDLTGNILQANAAFLNLMGYRLEEIQGQHHRIFVTLAEASSPEYEQFWNDLGAGITRPGEYKRVRKDGSEIFINGSYSIIRSQDGRPLRVLKLATDVTIQKRQSERLKLIESTREKKLRLIQ